MKRIATHLGLACVLTLLAGCAPSPSDTGAAQLAVSVPQALSASVTRVSVTAIAADFPAVSMDLASSGSSWGGTLGNLPAGSNRTFLAQAFDTSGTKLYEGSASGVSIFADQTALVAITLQQVNAPPPFQNEAPIIDSLNAPSTSVTTGSVLSLEAAAHDPNTGDTLSYSWSSTGGTFASASAASTSWTAPASTGLQTLTLTVTDSQGLASTLSLTVSVTPSPVQGSAQFSISLNTFPQVSSLNASLTRLAVGQATEVSASVSDPDGDSLSYSWSASCSGTWSNASSSTVQFTPDALPAGSCNNCRLTVSVSDGRGGQTSGTVALCIRSAPATQHFSPFITSASGSSGLASPGQVLTYEISANDPEGSALSFSWAAIVGSLGAPVHSATTSRITWTAPSCAVASVPLSITATVTNAFGLSATQSFSVTGLPTCPSGWASTGALAQARFSHAAELLADGRVLVTGGAGSGILSSAELYNPLTGTWSTTNPMGTARYLHTATRLPNGKVLVLGGASVFAGSPLATAELYDPATGTWSTAAPMASARQEHTVTLLNNGKVLVVGGYNSLNGVIAAAELYDPATGTWSTTGAMSSPRQLHSATLLSNGKVLVVGGGGSTRSTTTAEVYDPATGLWSAAASPALARVRHSATLLPNGKVLIAGGDADSVIAAAELYDPSQNSWSTTGSMGSPRASHSALLVSTGKVVVLNRGTAVEAYDPGSGTWSATGSAAANVIYGTATLLNNGRVLLAAGAGPTRATADLYTP